MKGALLAWLRRLEQEAGLHPRPYEDVMRMENRGLLALCQRLEEEREALQSGPSVTWNAHYGLESGYGHAGAGYLRALERAGVRVRAVFPHHVHLGDLEHLAYKAASPSIQVDHGVPLYWKGEGRHRVGFTVYETTLIPPQWPELINRLCDEVWTASGFCRVALENSGVERPIHVHPHCLDLDVFRPGGPKMQLPTEKPFRFLALGDLHGRKGWDIYLRAFIEEFTAEEPVCAVFRSYGGREETWRAINKLSDRRPLPEIHVIAETWIPDMPSLLRSVDCVVVPSRGEGFGLLGLEGMACGCSVVATGWGGQTEYLTEENGYPVDYTLTEIHSMDVLDDYRALRERGALFAEPDHDSMRMQMRRCFENEAERRAKRMRGLEDVRRFGLESVGAAMRRRIEEIWSDLRSA